MIRRTRYISALALLATFAVACDAEEEQTPAEAVAEEVPAVDPAVLASMPGVTAEHLNEGRQLFVVCSVCHGVDGNGTQLGPSLRDTVWTHITPEVGAVAGLIRSGVRSPQEFETPMPEMGGGHFDDHQLQAVAAYVVAISQDAM